MFKNNDIKREFIGGLTTFLSMSYVLFVIPATLMQTGMNQGALFSATAISTIIATLFMGLYAKYPVAIAPGMGMQAFFTYTVVLNMGYTWQEGLFSIFIASIIFFLLSIFGIRKMIIGAIPSVIKDGIGIAVGLFITFIGLQSAGIIIGNDATLVGLGDLSNPITLISIIGVIITLILLMKDKKIAVFIGIVISTILGIILTFVMGYDLNISYTGILAMPHSIASSFGQVFTVDIFKLLTDFKFWIVIFSTLLVDFFDTTGTLIAVSKELENNDEIETSNTGELKGAKKLLIIDSLSIMIGSIIGVSSMTVYAESMTGIKSGARTGLSSIFVAMFFFLALFFSPLLSLVGVYATAPAMIVVGLLIASHKVKISNQLEGFSLIITILMTVLTYSISSGLGLGIITYTILSLFTEKRKDNHWLLYVLSGIFMLYFIMG